MSHPNKRPLSSLPKELRRTTVPDAVRAWVHRSLGAPVVRVRRLTGASSTSVHALSLDDGRRVVLRRYVWPGFLEDEPIAPVREADAMRFAHRAGLPVPDVLAADPTGEEVGDGVPVLLMSMVRGEALAHPDVHRLAEVAASIHAVDATGIGHEWFRWYAEGHKWLPPGEVWERAHELWLAGPPEERWGLCHRDYHPGNVLWSSRSGPSIVDWANACRGPSGTDVAHCRANLFGLHGWRWDVADEFQRAYEAITGTTFHPWFELGSVLEHDLDRLPPEWHRAGEDRLRRALTDLGG